jgi:hypothetical protein
MRLPFQKRKVDNDVSNDPQTWGQFIRSMLWERPIELLLIVLAIISIVIIALKIIRPTGKIVIPGGTEINLQEKK